MTTTDEQPHQQDHGNDGSMPMMETDIIYDPERMAHLLVPDDGYQNELQAWAQGPGLQAGASWASSVYSF
ncbi:MAG: hypothetical protein SEPTF4163_000757 [Sporothrix epigloea]